MIEKYFWIREPILPISFFTDDISKKEYDSILSLLNNKELAKAIEFSSPSLIKECNNYQNKSDKKKKDKRKFTKLCFKISFKTNTIWIIL